MADIRINDLPLESSPTPSEFVAIDGVSTRKTTIQNLVNSGAPVATQAKAEAGTDNNDRMTALTTKQSIDFNSVPLSRTVSAGTGLSGGGNLFSNISLALSSPSIASLALADTSVQPSRQVIAGSGLSGGGPLSTDVTLNLSASTQTSLSLANTAIQDGNNALVPNGGTTGQVLVKNSNTNRDTGWATVSAATAVSYTAQSLNAAQQQQARSNISAALKGHIFGMTIANNATDAVNDIDISAGECASTEANPVLMVLASSLTKRIDAVWAVGSGNGGLDTGTVSDNTYHVWIIQRSDTGVVDALFSLSPTSPNMPSGYDRKRRIASIPRVGGALLGIIQDGDDFTFSTMQANSTVTNPGTAGNLIITKVPTGIRVKGKFAFGSSAASGALDSPVYIRVSDPSSVDSPATISNFNFIMFLNSGVQIVIGSELDVFTDTNARVRVRLSGSAGGTVYYLQTIGWTDTRGRS